MGDNVMHCCLSQDLQTQFLAEYVAKTHSFTKKVVRLKILIQNVL